MTTRALVIGCGGTIGGAWTVAALAALCSEIRISIGDFDVLQGTSAGAELVTMLGAGISVDELVAMQRGETTDPRLSSHLAAAPPGLPPIPTPRLMNPRLLRSQSGLAALTGIAPTGRADAAWLQRLADDCTDGRWLAHPAVRLVAFDVDRGERVAFGAPTAPAVDLGQALRASWAIPGWLPPVEIDGRRYVDGGARSTASVDLISADEADVVYVIAPMASDRGERVPGAGGHLENLLLRRPMSRTLDREVAEVRGRGTTVVTITPDRRDLAGLGANFMNRRRRRSAFEAAMVSAPAAVRRALAAAG
ncbi:patatin-like phospholipase family protein [Mycobacterium sp. M1]|uniref:Patatin-like phospholipase family protein n=1 Tax=Mycolicibacter acidiphilus TaxID=2835306 RepID=A0ABS5RJV0_9MYCO|nr:patatin-like phospholipase family protein [Mycolicibacter acidiphilus]MBS9534568.1 patatin-like phospholipase family protein [Mycolicibacter acidiphilus]